MERSVIEHLLKRAVWAPSGDNSQPWSFHVEDDTVHIFAHPDRDHEVLNVEARGTYIAIGALIENFVIASQAEGFAVVSAPIIEGAIAAFRLVPQERREDPLNASIEKRHTHRGPYQETLPVTIEDLERIPLEPHCSLVLIRDRERLQKISAAASVLEETVLKTKRLHRLFFSGILWNEKDAQEGAPGLYIKTTELPGPVQALFRVMRFWPVMRVLNALGLPESASATNAQVYAASGAMVGILLNRQQPEDFLAAGRVMQRVWLTITSQGLVAQPLAGLLYLGTYLEHTETSDISAEMKDKVAQAFATLRTSMNAEGVTPAMLMRVGIPLHPSSAWVGRKKPEIV